MTILKTILTVEPAIRVAMAEPASAAVEGNVPMRRYPWENAKDARRSEPDLEGDTIAIMPVICARNRND